MKKVDSLDWTNLSWESFQQIGIHIGDTVYNHLKFEEYLKQGNKQHGIDLYAYEGATEKYRCIQCKREKTMTTGAMAGMIREFREGQFYEVSSHFIIMTKLDLQSKNMQDAIKQYRQELAKDNIEFGVWDKVFLEKRLKTMYPVVDHYFGRDQADAFCFQPVFPRTKIEAPGDYLARQVRFIDAGHPRRKSPYWALQKKEPETELVSFFNSAPLDVHRLCVLGDPHQGKTQLLKHLAYKLENQPVAKICLWINAKSYNASTIEGQLNTQYAEWRTYGAFRLVVIIDGVDEVPEDRFKKVVRDIADFTTRCPSVSTIFSCRTTFYYNSNIGPIIPNFTLVELCSLPWANVAVFLDKSLSVSGAKKFLRQVIRVGLREELTNPFFLMELVRTFKNVGTVPTSRVEIITNLAGRMTEENMKKRQLTGAKEFSHYAEPLGRLTQRLAFTLQYAGLNGFKQEWMMELFSDDERQLLRQSALISYSGDDWSFLNAGYQEYLAAVALSKMDYDTIIAYVTKGVRSPIIKTKWIQTVAALISILPAGNLFDKLVAFVKNDDIELLFATEGSKFSRGQQLALLQSYINQSINKELGNRQSEHHISRFIYDNSKATDLLLDHIQDVNVPVIVRISCLRILSALGLKNQQKDRLYAICQAMVPATIEVHLAQHLLQAIFTFGKIDNEYLAQLVGNATLNDIHTYREVVYQLISLAGAVDQYYDYVIEGFAILVAYNKEITHAGSEISLHKMLASIATKESLEKLLALFNTTGWMIYHRNGIRIKEFNQVLSKHIEKLFLSDPTISDTIIKYLEASSKNTAIRYLGEMDNAFLATELGIIVGKHFVTKLPTGYPSLPFAIFQRNIDYFLSVAQAGGTDEAPGTLDVRNLWGAAKLSASLGGIRGNHPVLQQIKAAIEPVVLPAEELDIYTLSDVRKLEHDLEFIKSREAFFEAVGNFIDTCNQNGIPMDSAHWFHEENMRTLLDVDSYFIDSYLRSYGTMTSDKDVARRHLTSDSSFEFIRVEMILENDFISTALAGKLDSYLKDYFNKHVANLDFTNCVTCTVDASGQRYYSTKGKQNLVGMISLKVDLQTPFPQLLKLLWLDLFGYGRLDDWEDTPKSSYATLLLSYKQNHLLREQVMTNIETGIDCDAVLRTHIALIKHLKIREALDFLEEQILNTSVSEDIREYCVAAHQAIGGDISVLVSAFGMCSDFSSHLTLMLAEAAIDSKPDVVTQELQIAIGDPAVTDNKKEQYSFMLADHGHLEGFIYLVERIKAGHSIDHYRSKFYDMTKIPIGPALAALEDFGDMILTPSKGGMDDPKGVLMSIILGLGERSESSFELVCQYLERQQEKLKACFPNYKEINWYLRQAKERFRNYTERVATLDEVKDLFTVLSTM